jgi:hypothetical protein
MNSKKWVVATSALLGIAATLFVVPVIAQAPVTTTSSVMNKTYDLWVSQGFASPPFQPFHDCATFTKTKMCLAQCGDCGALSEVQLGPVSIWKGEVPCGGLNLVFTGTSRNGPEVPVIGASAVGNTQRTNFGAEGVRDQSCSLASTSTSGNTLYTKP